MIGGGEGQNTTGHFFIRPLYYIIRSVYDSDPDPHYIRFLPPWIQIRRKNTDPE